MSDDATLDEFADTIAEENEEGSRITGLGTFPSDWDVERITRCAEIRDSERIPLNSQEREQKKPGEIPYYGANGVLDYISEYIFDSELILLAEDGGHFEEYQERPVAYRISGKSWVNNHAHILEAKDEIATDYLFYSLEHRNLVPYVSGSTRSKLTQTMLKKVEVPLPPLSEQQKIATILHTVDQAIQKTEEIERQLHRVKKGAKQTLFTYGLNAEETQSHRIGDFPESWEFDKVSNLAEIERGNTPRTSHDEYYGGDITWVTPDDLSDLNEDGNGKYISDSGRKLTPEGVESSSLTVVEPDSVMFTSRSYGIGRTAICTVPAATNQGITAFNCSESLNTEFLYYYLNYIMDYIVSISGGSTFPEISKSATGNISLPVPNIDEQKEISSILSQLDEQILHNREVTGQLKKLKQGLMQDLLSGEVRTTDTDIDIPEEIAQYG